MNRKRITRVRDVMSDRWIRADGLETVRDALRRMQREDARCIIVERRNDDDEYGIVVLSDIARKVIAPDRSPERVDVYEIMTKPVISVPPDMNIRYAARLFDRFGLGLAPVIDAGEVRGIVTSADIVLHGLSPLMEE